jgi:hypothetical protein
MILIIEVVSFELILILLGLLVVTEVILVEPVSIVDIVAVALHLSVHVVRTAAVPSVDAALRSELLTTALVVSRASTTSSSVEALIKRILFVHVTTKALATVEWQVILIGPASHPAMVLSQSRGILRDTRGVHVTFLSCVEAWLFFHR